MKWLLFFLDFGISVYRWMVIARVIITWIPSLDYYHPVVRFIYDWTEPVLAPLRRLIPPLGGFDLSPIFVFLGLEFIRGTLLRIVLMF